MVSCMTGLFGNLTLTPFSEYISTPCISSHNPLIVLCLSLLIGIPIDQIELSGWPADFGIPFDISSLQSCMGNRSDLSVTLLLIEHRPSSPKTGDWFQGALSQDHAHPSYSSPRNQGGALDLRDDTNPHTAVRSRERQRTREADVVQAEGREPQEVPRGNLFHMQSPASDFQTRHRKEDKQGPWQRMQEKEEAFELTAENREGEEAEGRFVSAGLGMGVINDKSTARALRYTDGEFESVPDGAMARPQDFLTDHTSPATGDKGHKELREEEAPRAVERVQWPCDQKSTGPLEEHRQLADTEESNRARVSSTASREQQPQCKTLQSEVVSECIKKRKREREGKNYLYIYSHSISKLPSVAPQTLATARPASKTAMDPEVVGGMRADAASRAGEETEKERATATTIDIAFRGPDGSRVLGSFCDTDSVQVHAFNCKHILMLTNEFTLAHTQTSKHILNLYFYSSI